MKIQIVDIDPKKDSGEISKIINYYIKNTLYLYKDVEQTPDEVCHWLINKQNRGMSLIAAKDEKKKLLGLAYFDEFRQKSGYKLTVESSVYIDPNFVKKGLGALLLTRLIKKCQAHGYRCAIAVVDSKNEPSIRLHYKLGFIKSGILKNAAIKFQKFRDVVFMQKLIV